MKQKLHALGLWLSLALIALAAAIPLSAQPYPASSYELSYGGTSLVKWTGPETTIDMQADPILSKVTAIGYRAFSGCSSLASINIPEKVAVIGN